MSSRTFFAWAPGGNRVYPRRAADRFEAKLKFPPKDEVGFDFLLSVLTFSPSQFVDFFIFFDSEFARKEDFVLNYSDSEADQIVTDIQMHLSLFINFGRDV
jgi:hypothetical protein